MADGHSHVSWKHGGIPEKSLTADCLDFSRILPRRQRRSSIAVGPSFSEQTGASNSHQVSKFIERSTSYQEFAEATASAKKRFAHREYESARRLHHVLTSLQKEAKGGRGSNISIGRLRDHFTRHGSVIGSRPTPGKRASSVIGSVVETAYTEKPGLSLDYSSLDENEISAIPPAEIHQMGQTIGHFEREFLIDSLVKFSCHTPCVVLKDLLAREIDLRRKHQQSKSDQEAAIDKKIQHLEEESLSSLSEELDVTDTEEIREATSTLKKELLVSRPSIPGSSGRQSALLFVDINGFTKLSTMLDVESLSKVINSYFDLIVSEVLKCGGDVLKFAGDAFFAEWRIPEGHTDLEAKQRFSEPQDSLILQQMRASLLPSQELTISSVTNSLEERVSLCVWQATKCAAAIVKKYSDFSVPIPNDSKFDKDSTSEAMLNVHCGVGVGKLIGLHVSDYSEDGDEGNDDHDLESRREYLFLGDAIDQVASAEQKASHGEVFISPEGLEVLSTSCDIPSELLALKEPIPIASRGETHVDLDPKCFNTETAGLLYEMDRVAIPLHKKLRQHCEKLRRIDLRHLHSQMALYAHPVVREEATLGSEAFPSRFTGGQNKHSAEAELRSVYTLFCKTLIAPHTTGYQQVDETLFKILGNIMHVTSRELDRYSGQLRQFIVDDKGVVLIATFGLRGSTFPNLVGSNCLPATFAIHKALREELGVENRIGATWGKVYCGVVGGVQRHEYCVLGAPVNLAARLMESPMNQGILVDEAVQKQAGSQFEFSSLQHVKAKGYSSLVAIYQPLHANQSHRRRATSQAKFTGRDEELTEIVGLAQDILDGPVNTPSSVVTIMGESGIGKSALGLSVISAAKAEGAKRKKRVLGLRSSSTESEQRIPLCAFRKAFLGATRELCVHDGSISIGENRAGSRRMVQNETTGPHVEDHVKLSPACGNMLETEDTITRHDVYERQKLWQDHALRPKVKSLQEQRRSLRSVNSVRWGHRHNFPASTASKSAGYGVSSKRSSIQSIKSSERRDSFGSIGEIQAPSVPYLAKLLWACEELSYPSEYADLVASQFLGLDTCHPVTHIGGRIPTVSELVEFVAQAFMKITDFADLIVLFVDDFQWIDSFTWKVIRALGQSGKQMLLICALRSHDKQALRRMSTAVNFKLEINLGPLDVPAIQQLVLSTLNFEELMVDEFFCSEVLRRTGGVPIYVLELLEALKRNKSLVFISDGKLCLPQNTGILDRDKGSALVESLLNRFDGLDIRLRKILQTCAVLGISFSLSDIVRVHPRIIEEELEQALGVAMSEIILVEIIEDDEDSKSVYSSVSGGSESRLGSIEISKTGMNIVGDRYFEFTHDMWRSTILTTMLEERKVELHRRIAEAMEKEKASILQRGDIPRLLTLLDHWKSCRDFSKTAPLALIVGVRLQEWDLMAQSLELYQDALDMCYENVEPVDETGGRLDDAFVMVSATREVLELILRLKIKLALCQKLGMGDLHQSVKTLLDARMTLKSSESTSHSLMIPILSELCSIKIDICRNDDEKIDDIDGLIQEFVDTAQSEGNPVHLARALSMQAMFFAEQGNYARAVKSQRLLQPIYLVQSHASSLIDVYEKDHAAECFSQSILWYFLLGQHNKAVAQANFVIRNHLPFQNPYDIDGIMTLILPAILVLKSVGKASIADYLLKRFVINAHHNLAPLATYWTEVFNPICYLLEIIKMEEKSEFDTDLLQEIQLWVQDEVNTYYAPDLLRLGHTIMGEICWRLGKLKQSNDPMQKSLLQSARWFLTPIARDTRTEPFLAHTALLFLNAS